MAYFAGDESVRYGDTDDDEEAANLDIEQTKMQLRRMSLDLNASGARRYGVVDANPTSQELRSKSHVKNTEGSLDSDDDTIVEEEEEVDELDVTEIEEVEEEFLEEEVIEEEVVDGFEVLEEIAEEYEEEEVLQPETIVEGVEDEDEEVEEDEEDEATEDEVREAIIYILKQEKPIDNGYLTSSQATRMMALPFKDMREIMKHFELCDNAGEPIQWGVIADIVTPEGQGDDSNDEDENSNVDTDEEDENELCAAHGYSYCVECEVGLESSSSSSDESDNDEVGSLGSGYDLQLPPKGIDDEGHVSDISKLDQTDFDDISD